MTSRDSVWYRFPRTAAHRFTEIFNREMNVPDGLCVRQAVEVEVSPSYGCEVECPKETHEGVDKQLAALRAWVAVIVTKVPFNRGRDASINDAGALPCCHICGVHGISVQANLWHALQQGGGTEKRPICGQSCHVLQPIRVAYAVVCVDTEPDAGDDSCRDVQRRNSGEACHVLRWCTETYFIAPKQDISAAVDEHNRVKAKRMHKVCVALSDRCNA